MAYQVDKRYNYQYDSTARAYAEPIIRPEPAKQPVKHRQPKPRSVDIVFGMQLSLCSVVLCISAFMYINSYATLSCKQRELNTLKNEMVNLKSEISDTEAKISEALNLDTIRERASKELGMREPLAHQIIYIQTQEQSYTGYDN